MRGALVEQRLRHPHSRLKAHLSWDVSFWVAFVFTIGSILWVGPCNNDCAGYLLMYHT